MSREAGARVHLASRPSLGVPVRLSKRNRVLGWPRSTPAGALMKAPLNAPKFSPVIVISPYQWVKLAVSKYNPTHVISILGNTDRLPWPLLEDPKVLRLGFDDTYLSTKYAAGPTPQQIRSLIDFAKEWGGHSSMLIHCRAGASRSPSAALIAAAAIGRRDLFARLLDAKTYFRPNRRMLELASKILVDDELRLLRPADHTGTPSSKWGVATIQLQPH